MKDIQSVFIDHIKFLGGITSKSILSKVPRLYCLWYVVGYLTIEF